MQLLSPPILFFFLGVLATLVRSDLEVPKSVGRLLSLYLLMAIGRYGGYKLGLGELGPQSFAVMGSAMLASFAMPLVTFVALRIKLSPEDAAAIAAALEPILRRYGGLCLISDAMVIRNGT
jgi:hypothetical protein